MLVYSIAEQRPVSEQPAYLLNDLSHPGNKAMHVRHVYTGMERRVGKVRSRDLGLLSTLQVHPFFVDENSFPGSDLDPTPLWYYSLELCVIGVIYI